MWRCDAWRKPWTPSQCTVNGSRSVHGAGATSCYVITSASRMTELQGRERGNGALTERRACSAVQADGRPPPCGMCLSSPAVNNGAIARCLPKIGPLAACVSAAHGRRSIGPCSGIRAVGRPVEWEWLRPTMYARALADTTCLLELVACMHAKGCHPHAYMQMTLWGSEGAYDYACNANQSSRGRAAMFARTRPIIMPATYTRAN